MQTPTTRIRRVAALALAVLLVASACTRSGDDAVERGGDGDATTTSTAPSAVDDVDAALAKGTFGPVTDVCGPAPAGEPNVEGTTQGVDTDKVVIGTFADPGNQPQPGLNEELFTTATVFTKWCNDLGGIHGRKIELKKHDAKLFEFDARMVDACQSDFFLVGGGGVFDDAGQKTRLKCLLPEVPGFRVTPEALGSDLSAPVSPVSLDAVGFGIAEQLNATYPQAKSDIGILTGNAGATITQAAMYKEAGTHFGWKYVYEDQYNAVGESTWVPYAQKIASSGVKGLVYVGSPTDLGLLVQALDQVGAELDWVLGTPNTYDAKLITSGGDALAKVPVYAWMESIPFEAADTSDGLQALQALFAKYAPDAPAPTFLAVSAMQAWLLFAKGAGACGAELTRTCALEQAQKHSRTWDGAGMSAPPGKGCWVATRAKPDGFAIEKWKPNEGLFHCDPESIVKLAKPIGKGTTLADVGRSLKDLD